MKKLLAMLLAMMCLLSLVACGGNKDNSDDSADKGDSGNKATVYAVEAGSAGEAAALTNGWETVPVDDQAKALMEVDAGTSDAAIIDLLMAGAMVGEGTSYPNLTLGDKLTTEMYGAGCRKGSDLTDFINRVMAKAYASGEMQKIATTYGVQESLVEQAAIDGEFTAAAGGDVEYIKGKGKLVVGITEFAPMDYKDDKGEWIGFDADMARMVAKELGVEIEFVVIDWNSKIMELDGKSIDVVWNGMTLTDEVMAAMNCTNAYCNNAQVVVTKAK